MDAKSALLSKSRALPGLRENEKLLTQTIISNAIYWKGVAVLVVAFIFLFIAFQLSIFFALIGVLMLIYAHLRKLTLLLAVTNQRVLARAGILMVDMIQLQFNRIESVELQTPPIGQIFGYSTVMVSGTGSRLAFIPFVANPITVQNYINEILQQRDVTSQEHIQLQAKVQAEALAEVLDDHQESK